MSENRPYRQGIGIVLLNKDGLAFAGCRADRQEVAWQLPQRMEPDGNPVSAAFRELKEEVRGDKRPGNYRITDGDYPDPGETALHDG